MPAINDYQVERNWRAVSIPAAQFCSAAESTLDSLTLNEGTPNTLNTATITTGLGGNGLPLQNINSTGLFGVLMNTPGDLVKTLFRAPYDIDYLHPVYVRVLWTSGSSTTADTITWKAFYKVFSPNNDQLSGTINTALDTVIPQDTVAAGTAFTICQTAPGKIDANQINDEVLLGLAVEMDAKAGGLSEDVFFLGLELLYVPHVFGTKYGAGIVGALPAGWS